MGRPVARVRSRRRWVWRALLALIAITVVFGLVVRFYGRRRHVINLFVWPESGRRAPSRITRQGYHAVHGVGSGVEYWAVSDLDPSELESFVASLRLHD